MKLLEILGKVGSSIVREVVPGGGLIVDAVNTFLPDDKKLPANASGADITRAAASLPPEQQAALMSKEFDIEITEIKESYATVRAMLDSDAKNPQSTRPYIAKHAFHVVAFTLTLTVSMWAYGVGSGKVDIIKEVNAGWPFVLTIIGTPVALLMAYFGILKTESKNRLDAASGGAAPSGVASVLASIFKR
jgi:hypothetical protein